MVEKIGKVASDVKLLKETPQALAARVLRSIIKSSQSAVHLDEIPHDLLFGEKVDLSRWSLILTDNSIRFTRIS